VPGKLRRHLSYSNVIATIALFLAMGGGAIAAVVKLKPNQVKSKHIAPDAVTGADANESSFGTVPTATNATNATNAVNATSVGGTEIRRLDFRTGTTGGPTTILNDFRGLTLSATCTAGALSINADTSINGSEMEVWDNTQRDQVAPFNTSTNPSITGLLGNGGPNAATLVYSNPSGGHVTADFQYNQLGTLGGAFQCLVGGYAIG
jgi:hypothetical protein